MSDKTSKESLDSLKERTSQLKSLLPEAVVGGKINFERLRMETLSL